ncbi:MAG: hypothetical protein ACI4B6_09850 [Atopobiaceae bacterium]
MAKENAGGREVPEDARQQADAAAGEDLRRRWADADELAGHKRMPMSERAKIFVPFNALKGLDEALRQQERLADERMKAEVGGNDLEAPDSDVPDDGAFDGEPLGGDAGA